MKKLLIGLAAFLAVPVLISGMLLASTLDDDSDSNEAGCSVDSSTSITLKDSDFNETTFKKVVSEKGGAFKNHADKIIEVAKKSGVNPSLMGAIMASETGWGTSEAIVKYNNPSGQMIGNGLIVYSSLDEGIEATGQTLKNLVITRKKNTIEQLGSVYAPVGATNDPNNLNANWVPIVTSIMKTMGGNIKTISLGDCVTDISVNGDKLSYYDSALKLADSVKGTPYLLGAPETLDDHPSAFDCGLFTLWLFQKMHINVKFNRIAQNQYNNTERVKEAKLGDLIFFKNTYDTGHGEEITHVGIVVSKNEFYGANSNGVEKVRFDQGYWKEHFAGFGRVKTK